MKLTRHACLALAALSMTCGSASGAFAQSAEPSAENAGKFFDQVALNGATRLYPATVNSYDSTEVWTTLRATTTGCISYVEGKTENSYYPNFSAQIDWSRLTEARSFFDDKTKPGLILIGGGSTKASNPDTGFVYNKLTGDRPLFLQTGVLSLDERLKKAMDVLRRSCAKDSFGF